MAKIFDKMKSYISKNGFKLGWTFKRKAPKRTWKQKQKGRRNV